ncbi:hypothetical protein [Bosea sp. (in: a-proteobacteria)]|uniref:hypothetical protein n=1 Tax=Bosea sp. (in: a-proteobacteria) TaxID=1871050 RepID=UPI003F7BA401
MPTAKTTLNPAYGEHRIFLHAGARLDDPIRFREANFGKGALTEGIVAKQSYFDRTPEENYALFLNALAGIEDDAGMEGYSQEGIRLLREALEEFRSEYRVRHGR